jgi:DNA-3-methyladenine glycosylase
MNKNFFSGDAKAIAKVLLGKHLIRRVNGKTRSYMIVETEAYLGEEDKASHARSGKTKRNEPMFGPPGHWYVYFTYGMHYMLNLVTGKDCYPSAVLIRGIISAEDLTDQQNPYANVLKNISIRKTATRKGKGKKISPNLIGPGRLTKALKIGKALNGKLAGKASGLWIEDRGVKIKPKDILRTPRIGIGYAEEWVPKPLRFILKGYGAS